jgi:hypothetical protein
LKLINTLKVRKDPIPNVFKKEGCDGDEEEE